MFVHQTGSSQGLFAKRTSALDHTVSEEDLVGSSGADRFDRGEAAMSAGIGAVVGAGVGAFAGDLVARHEINQVPIQTVTETWRAPVTENKTLGLIPHGQYFPAGHLGSILSTTGIDDYGMLGNSLDRPSVHPDMQATDPVVRAVPVVHDGNAIFQEVTKTFSGHGAPVLHTETHQVTIPSMTGFEQHQQDETHLENRYTGQDPQTHQATFHLQSVLDGVRVSFEPNIKETPVGGSDHTYVSKDVTFNSGINTGGLIAEGAIIGAGAGALVGLAGDVARQTLMDRHRG